jgi:hypothetical protein
VKPNHTIAMWTKLESDNTPKSWREGHRCDQGKGIYVSLTSRLPKYLIK